MIRVPLKSPILLSTSTSEFVCTIVFAGKDTFQAENVYKRIYFDNGTFKDVFLAEKYYFDRTNILGYAKYELEKVEKPKVECKILNLIKRD